MRKPAHPPKRTQARTPTERPSAARPSAMAPPPVLDPRNRPIVWEPRFSVGVPVIDKDHQTLVDLINQLGPAADDPEAKVVVGSVLETLWDYVLFHFAREEKLLELIKFPNLAKHKAKHESLKASVARRLDAYRTNPDAVDIDELLGFLQTWLMDHILREDMRYKPLATNNKKAQAEVEQISFIDVFGDESFD